MIKFGDGETCVQGKAKLLRDIDLFIEDESKASGEYRDFMETVAVQIVNGKGKHMSLKELISTKMFGKMSNDEAGHESNLLKFRKWIEKLPEC